MPLVETASLVFIPDYQFFSVRDYEMVEQAGAREALAAAHTEVIAAGEFEVFVVCAQDQLKIELVVSVHDEPVDVDTAGWDDTRGFALPFPSGVLHAGDAFGRVVNLDLPGAGTYTVVVQHSGRADAAAALRREWAGAAALPLDQARAVLDRWAALERYQVSVFPPKIRSSKSERVSGSAK